MYPLLGYLFIDIPAVFTTNIILYAYLTYRGYRLASAPNLFSYPFLFLNVLFLSYD